MNAVACFRSVRSFAAARHLHAALPVYTANIHCPTFFANLPLPTTRPKAPGVVEAGAVLLEEAAVLLKRQDAKRILADPTWKFANPVIQLNSNK